MADSVLFDRERDQDDVWDDTELIKQYDACKKEFLEKMGLPHGDKPRKVCDKSRNSPRRPKMKGQRQKYWSVGDPCQTKYSGDEMLYEATVIAIYPELGTCHVRFVGYNNEEEVKIESLRRSRGEAARREQKAIACGDVGAESPDESEEEQSSYLTLPPKKSASLPRAASDQVPRETPNFIPPSVASGQVPHGMPNFIMPGMPPGAPYGVPNFIPTLHDADVEDVEALSSMLMSWYMCGHHTGYYAGLKAAEKMQQESAAENIQPKPAAKKKYK